MRNFVFALMLVACGGDSGVDVNANANNVCGEIAEVACHNLYQCCAEGEIEDFLGVSEPRTELQCRDDVEVLCDRRAASRSASIKAGRVRFDSKLMNDCLNALVAPDDTCATVESKLPWTEACMNEAWVGTVAADGACLFTFDCAGGADSFCAPNQKCAQRPTAGMPCGSGCASAFYCQAGTCAMRIPQDGVCTSTIQCAKDLFCDTTAAQPRCIARAPGGSPCTSSAGCASNQCIPGQCMGTGSSCFTDTNCSMHCQNSAQTCTTASQCGIGTCSVTTTQTCSGATCPVGETCNFPTPCIPGDCIGDPVCTAQTVTVDYCTGAVPELPLF